MNFHKLETQKKNLPLILRLWTKTSSSSRFSFVLRIVFLGILGLPFKLLFSISKRSVNTTTLFDLIVRFELPETTTKSPFFVSIFSSPFAVIFLVENFLVKWTSFLIEICLGFEKSIPWKPFCKMKIENQDINKPKKREIKLTGSRLNWIITQVVIIALPIVKRIVNKTKM